MNPSMLALSAANPGLLPLAFSGGNGLSGDDYLEILGKSFLCTIALFSFLGILVFSAEHGAKQRKIKHAQQEIVKSEKFDLMKPAKEVKVLSRDGRIQNRLEGVVILNVK